MPYDPSRRYTCVVCGKTKHVRSVRRVASEFIGDRIAAWVHASTNARRSLRSLVGKMLGKAPVFQEGDRVCTQCMENCHADAVVYAIEETHDKFAAPGACTSCGRQCAARKTGLCRRCYDKGYQARIRAKLGDSHKCPRCSKSLGERKTWHADGTCDVCRKSLLQQRLRAKLGDSHKCPNCGKGLSESTVWKPNGTCHACYKRKRRNTST